MTGENVFLFHSLLMGIFITFLYDLLRIFRRVIVHRNFWVSVEDLVFWGYCATEVFLLMHYESNGTLRWFAVLGALTGMAVYRKTVSGFFVKYTTLLMGKILDLLRKIMGFLFRPLKAAGGKALKAGGKAGSAVVTIGQRLRRFCRRCGERLKKKLTFLLKMIRMNL